MRKFKRLTMTLALLIMAVGGAWAQSSLNVVEIVVPTNWEGDHSYMTVADLTGFKAVTLDEAKAWKGAPKSDAAMLLYAFDDENAYYVAFDNGAVLTDSYAPFEKDEVFGNSKTTKFYYTASDTIELKPDADKKVWTLAEMPASDVELQVEYFAESNLFLSKEAQADKGSISVKAGELGVQFGDDGKSANTVTEGSPMTVTYNGTKKLLGMKVAKKEAAAPTTTVTWNSSDFYFDANPYTKDGVTLTPSNDMAANGDNLYEYGDNTFTTTLGKFIKIEIVFRDYSSPVIDGWTKETAGQYQPSPEQLPDFWADIYKLTWTGNADSVTLKGKDVYGIQSITFTIQ